MFEQLPSPYQNYAFNKDTLELGRMSNNGNIKKLKPKSKSSFDVNMNNKHHILKIDQLLKMVSSNNTTPVINDNFLRLAAPYNKYIYNQKENILINSETNKRLKNLSAYGHIITINGVPEYLTHKTISELLTTEVVVLEQPKDNIYKLTGELANHAFNPATKELYVRKKGSLYKLKSNYGSGYTVYNDGKTTYFSMAKLKEYLSNEIAPHYIAPSTNNDVFILEGEFSNYAYNPSSAQLYRILRTGYLRPLKSKNGSGYRLVSNTGDGIQTYYSKKGIKSKMSSTLWKEPVKPVKPVKPAIVWKEPVKPTKVIIPETKMVTVTPNVLEYNIAVNPTEKKPVYDITTGNKLHKLPGLLSNYIFNAANNTLSRYYNGAIYVMPWKTSSKNSWTVILKGSNRTLTLDIIFQLIKEGKTTIVEPQAVLSIFNKDTDEENKPKPNSVWILINKGTMAVEPTRYNTIKDAEDDAVLKTESTGNLYEIFQFVAQTNKGKTFITR